ncbi:MAG: MraY family glycosyltransferase [Patescibacteria group bacterium]
MLPFLAVILASFAVSALATPLVIRLARHFDVLDAPVLPRKIHQRPTPLLGGIAVFAGLAAAVGLCLWLGWLPALHIRLKYLAGLLLAALILIFGGSLDDKFDLRPSRQIIWPALAALIVVASGIGVGYVTNPFGGQIYLDRQQFTVLWWDGLPYRLTLIADLFSFCWLLGMIYTTKLLDGLDGLVSGVTVIGALIIAAVSLMKEVAQPDTALLAFAVAGAFAGFLIFNFNPARIFLGEGGSTLAGFLLGTLAIISGGKIATALLVLGLPIFDTVVVVARRIFWYRRSMATGDRTHLHFRLIDMGLSQRQTVLFYYFAAALFGSATLFLQGWEKIVALGLIASLIAAVLSFWTAWRRRTRPAANDSIPEDQQPE